MNDYCEHCPVAKLANGMPCPGRTVIHSRPAVGRYCELVDPSHPAYVPGYDASVLEAAQRPQAPSRAAAPLSPAPIDPLSPEQRAAFEAEFNACPHRSRDTTCRCRQHKCALGKGTEGYVTTWECSICLGYVDQAGHATDKGLATEDTAPLQHGDAPAGPSLLRRLGNAAKAAVRVVDQAAHGRDVKVPAEEAAARLAICRACDRYKALTQTCEHPDCGCFLPVKTTLATEVCPLGKWGSGMDPAKVAPDRVHAD